MPGGLLREEMFELSGRRSDSSQWTQWIPKAMGHSAAAVRFCALPVIHHRKGRSTMATKALLVRLEAKSGKEDAVEEFLLSALPLVEQEPGTKPWFAVRFGPSTFGIIDAFPDEAARETHLGGPVGKALAEKADELFASAPEISNLDVIANKL